MKIKRNPIEVPASLKNIDLNRFMRRTGIYEKQERYKNFVEAAKPMARKLLDAKKVKTSPPVPKVRGQFTDDEVQAYWQKQIHTVEVIEAKFEMKVQQFIEKIGHKFLMTLDAEVTTNKQFVAFLKKDFFDDNEEELLTQAGIDFTPLLDSVAMFAGNEANRMAGVKDPYLGFNYRKQISANVDKFTKSMLDTDRQHLTDIITNGIKDGKSIPEIRGVIEEDFSDYSKMQATRIGRTEVLRASTQASLDAWQQSGVVEGKEWVTAGADDECADYEGQIEALDGSFYSDTTDFADGDPPLHPNCRCVLIPVLLNEKAYVVPVNQAYVERIKQLEGMLDKRTKEAKELMSKRADGEVYIKSLEKHLGIADKKE